MRVCLLTAEFSPQVGGLGDYTHHLATALSTADIDVDVLTSPVDGRACVDTDERLYTLRRSIASWDFGLLRQVEDELQSLKPDILHIQYQTGAYGMHPAVNLLPRWLHWQSATARTVTTFHDLRDPYLFPKAGPVRSWATRQLVQYSNGIVLTNPEDEVAVRPGLGATQVARLIAIGSNIPACPTISASDKANVRERLGVGATEPLLGYFGLPHPSKGIETLFHALAMIRSRGDEVTMLMIGGVEPTSAAGRYVEHLQQLAVELGIADVVRWTGYLSPSQVAESLATLDCCVLPFTDGASYRHGTLIAAMAAGAPVITTQPAHSLPNTTLPALSDGDNCRLVTPNDPKQLAEAIGSALSSSEQRKKLSTGALMFTRSFTWEAIAAQTVSLYQEVMAA